MAPKRKAAAENTRNANKNTKRTKTTTAAATGGQESKAKGKGAQNSGKKESDRKTRAVNNSKVEEEQASKGKAQKQVESVKTTPKKAAKKDSEEPKSKKHTVEPVTDPSDVPEGVKRDKRGRLVFKDFPKFRPTLTPKQVIQAGSFGGIYFNPTGGRKSVKYPDGVDISADEFPEDWFEGLRDEQYKGKRYNIQLNKYKVKSGQNQQQWEEQGWIRDQDPRGWFHWYCRFTLGRRTDDDKRQISRWTGVAGPKGRWKTRLFNTVKDAGGDVTDGSISPVIRQNLLHWAYELTPEDYEAMARGERY